MKRLPIFVLATLALGSAASGAGVPAADPAGADHHHPSHHHPHAADDGLAAPAGSARWASDGPLRSGMWQMRDALDALAPHEHGQLEADQVRELTAVVEEAAAYMFAHCELDPEPDHALHGILARLLGGARSLHEKPSDPSPLVPMREALDDYSRLFYDPPPFERGDES